MKAAKYKVHEVEERTGIPATTLRQWERRYGFPKPERSASGYRLYSEHDLKHIKMMQKHISEGISASRAAELVQLDAKVSNQARSLEQLRYELLQAFCELNEEEANRILGEAYSLYPVDDVMFEIIQHTMVRIGQMWHDGKIRIAIEHFASSYVMGKLRALLNTSPNRQSAPAVVVACSPHEHHAIGSLMLAICLRRAGHRVYYLGQNMPLADLRQFTHDVQASAVMLSASTAESLKYLQEGKAFLQDIAPILVFGGWVFSERPDLAQELGGVYLGNNLRTISDALERKIAASTSPRKSTQNMIEHLSSMTRDKSKDATESMGERFQPLQANDKSNEEKR